MAYNVVSAAKKLGGQISDNKKAILGAQVGGVPGAVVGSTYDPNGAGSKTFGNTWDNNVNGIRGAAVGGAPAAVVGSTMDNNGVLKTGIRDTTAAINALAPKVGLGAYKAPPLDVGGNGISANALNAATQVGARPSVVTPITYNLGAYTPAASTAYGAAPMQDVNQSNEARAIQMGLANQLTNQANGVGPSLAQIQLQKGKDANIASAMALGASQRGVTAGQGLRSIADATANANQVTAQQAAELRLQEQQQAQALLSGVATNVRGQDIGVAGANQTQLGAVNLAQGGANLSTNLANATAANANTIDQAHGALGAATATGDQALKQQAQNDQAIQAYMNMGLSWEEAKLKAQGDANTLASNNYNSQQTRTSNMVAGAAQGIASYATGGATTALGAK